MIALLALNSPMTTTSLLSEQKSLTFASGTSMGSHSSQPSRQVQMIHHHLILAASSVIPHLSIVSPSPHQSLVPTTLSIPLPPQLQNSSSPAPPTAPFVYGHLKHGPVSSSIKATKAPYGTSNSAPLGTTLPPVAGTKRFASGAKTTSPICA